MDLLLLLSHAFSRSRRQRRNAADHHHRRSVGTCRQNLCPGRASSAPPTAHLLSSDTVLARSPVRGGCWHSLDHPRPDQAVGKPPPGARRASGGWRRYGVLGQAVVHQPLRLLGSKPARHVSPPAYGGGPKSSQPQIGPYHQFSSSLALGRTPATLHQKLDHPISTPAFWDQKCLL